MSFVKVNLYKLKLKFANEKTRKIFDVDADYYVVMKCEKNGFEFKTEGGILWMNL